jgi:transcriptional regulator with GAF, ATPase, and Fis domain
VESALFGHEKGAFTGRFSRQDWKFRAGGRRNLFIDEIGTCRSKPGQDPAVSGKAPCERVGGSKPLAIDVRIVAATHRDLTVMLRQGTFREDLYHRLNVFPLRLPPLRERREDIPLLAERFLDGVRPGLELSVAALQRLLAHDWRAMCASSKTPWSGRRSWPERGKSVRNICGLVRSRPGSR